MGMGQAGFGVTATRPRLALRIVSLLLVPLILSFLMSCSAVPAVPGEPTATVEVVSARTDTPSSVDPVATSTSTETQALASATPHIGVTRQPVTPLAGDGATIVDAFALSGPPGPGRCPNALVGLDGRIYSANRGSDTVSVIEGDEVVAVLAVGRDPSAIAADPHTGRVYVLNQADATLSVIRGVEVVDTWKVPGPAEALALLEGRLWVGAMQGGVIHLLSTDDGTEMGRVTLSTASAVLRLVPHALTQRMYVATYGNVHIVDAESLQELQSRSLNSYRLLAASPSGDTLYVGEYNSEEQRNYLLILSADDLQTRSRIPLPSDPSSIRVHPHNGLVYVASGFSHELLLIDPQRATVLARRVVGLSPRTVMLDANTGHLYVGNCRGDNVVVVDAADLTILTTIPLVTRFEDMAVDSASGRLYVATGSRDQVLTFDRNGLLEVWTVRGYPSRVEPLPGRGLVAVYSQAEGSLHLLDETGQSTRFFALQEPPGELWFDPANTRLYAGGTVIDTTDWTTQTLRLTTAYQSTVVPREVFKDTRRDRLYAVAFNGVPGSNGGLVVRRLDEQDGDDPRPVPGRLSVIDIVYDEIMDRFYSTNARMWTFGLQISDAADASEVLYLPLAHHPIDMVLNPATHHLWLALSEEGVVAYDTRTWGRVLEWPEPSAVSSMALDAENGGVYLADSANGVIYVLRDAAAPPPPAPTLTPTPSPWPSPTATSRPTSTAVPTMTPQPTPRPTCSFAVDERLRGVWEALGGAAGYGCPVAEAEIGFWAAQPFERGRMFWREATRAIFVLREDGSYATYGDQWQEGMDDYPCQADPPGDLHQPVRGFGLLWCRQDGIREALGWATAPEYGLEGLYQPFTGGGLLLDESSRVWVLQRDGTWRVLNP